MITIIMYLLSQINRGGRGYYTEKDVNNLHD